MPWCWGSTGEGARASAGIGIFDIAIMAALCLCPMPWCWSSTGEGAKASTGTGIVDIDIIVVFCVVDIDIIVLSFFRKPCC